MLTPAATPNRPLTGAPRRIDLARARTASIDHSPSVNTAPQPQISPSGRVLEGPLVPESSLVAIAYIEKSPVRVRGLATGHSYEFSPSNPIREVDAQDASALLNTRFFRRV